MHTNMSNASKQKPIEWVICRHQVGIDKDGKKVQCNATYAKWKNPFCHFHWNKYYKKTGYIFTQEDLKYCT